MVFKVILRRGPNHVSSLDSVARTVVPCRDHRNGRSTTTRVERTSRDRSFPLLPGRSLRRLRLPAAQRQRRRLQLPVDHARCGHQRVDLFQEERRSAGRSRIPSLRISIARRSLPGSRTPASTPSRADPSSAFPKGNLFPFVHVLGGAAEVGGPRFQPCTWGLGLTAGGGLDYVLPFWKKHLAVRVFQLDYEYMNVDFGPADPHGLVGGTANINALRASTGIVLRLGDLSPLPAPSLECKVNPTEIYPGDPVTVDASLKTSTSRSPTATTGPQPAALIPANASNISIETKNLAPGTYTSPPTSITAKRPTSSPPAPAASWSSKSVRRPSPARPIPAPLPLASSPPSPAWPIANRIAR